LQGGNTRVDITSPTNTFNIPSDTAIALAAEGVVNGPGLEMRLTERYDRSGRKAQAHSRWLKVHAGIRGLVNMEVVDPTGVNDPGVLQLVLDGSSEVPNSVFCGVTNATDSSLSCSASLDLASNRVLGTIAVTGSPALSFEITFSDSLNGTVQLNSLVSSDTWNGTARIVNPELTARSEIRYSQGVLEERTYVNFLNPVPMFDRGVLSSNTGQDLGAGVATPITLWDGDYLSQFYSYLVYPLDGVLAQKNAAVMSFNTGSSGLLNADRFTINLDNNQLDPTATLRYAVDYAAPDPNALFTTGNVPPDRGDFTVRINSVVVTANTGSFGDPIPVTESDTIELSWPDVTADSADTRWQVRMGKVLTSGGAYVAHEERRTERLDHTAAGSGLTLGGGNWTWTSPADFLTGESNGTSAIVRFHVRASNVANTMRGQSRGIHFVVTP
ncbi:hypothetical protein, partial [Kaarinaea lacus]